MYFSKFTRNAPLSSSMRSISCSFFSAASIVCGPTLLSPVYSSKRTFSRAYSSSYFLIDSSRQTRQFLSASSSPSSIRLKNAAASSRTFGSFSASAFTFT